MTTMLEQKTEDFQRSYLDQLLEQCTKKQRDFFNYRCFPDGVPLENLASAVALCERTLKLHG